MSLRSEQRKRDGLSYVTPRQEAHGSLAIGIGEPPTRRAPPRWRYLKLRISASQLRAYQHTAKDTPLDDWLRATLDAAAEDPRPHRSRAETSRDTSRYLSGGNYAAEILGYSRLHGSNRARLDGLSSLGYALALAAAVMVERVTVAHHRRTGYEVARVMIRCKELLDGQG